MMTTTFKFILQVNRQLMLAVILTLFGSINAWSQSAISDIPEVINASDATITKMGHATMEMRREVVYDSISHRADTISQVVSIDYDTAPGTARKRMSRRKVAGSDFYDKDSSWWLDMWWFNYQYPSVNADGKSIVLSSMACMPDDDVDRVNNIIVGCHVTITSNKECPTSYTDDGSMLSDVSMLMNFAGSGLAPGNSVVAELLQQCCNLVILPDYEGYGVTKGNAHPYLYQELTARQVVDAVRYGKALYETSPQVSEVRHPFRDGWRTIPIGYSQGASVALATQRFIEQNGLSEELQLAGSICGDGPYDLLSTLMYYVGNDLEEKKMSMPVVLPLILKGMCDSNPYMKNHQVSDYLSERFLETGIIDWLTAKEKSTDDITKIWTKLYNEGKGGDANYFRSILTDDGKAYLKAIMKPAGYDYFKNLYEENKDYYYTSYGIPLPDHRGLMEDLHFALESNNMTMGWKPQHVIFLYHSTEDTVVPEKNRARAYNTLGSWVIKVKGSGKDHVEEGKSFYFFNSVVLNVCIKTLANVPVNQTNADAQNIRNSIDSGFLE